MEKKWKKVTTETYTISDTGEITKEKTVEFNPDTELVQKEEKYISDKELNEIIEELKYLDGIDDDPYGLKSIRKAALSH